jgi:hypothetical protein
MNPCTEISRCMSLIYFVFNLSISAWNERLNLYFFGDNQYSGVDENPREEPKKCENEIHWNKFII